MQLTPPSPSICGHQSTESNFDSHTVQYLMHNWTEEDIRQTGNWIRAQLEPWSCTQGKKEKLRRCVWWRQNVILICIWRNTLCWQYRLCMVDGGQHVLGLVKQQEHRCRRSGWRADCPLIRRTVVRLHRSTCRSVARYWTPNCPQCALITETLLSVKTGFSKFDTVGQPQIKSLPILVSNFSLFFMRRARTNTPHQI